jgi:glycine/D-amino acid oxidase-like deaminating enzyme
MPLSDNPVNDELSSSLWAATAKSQSDYSVLNESHHTDICIIGAGYTGLSTAIHLREKGVDVVVIDSHEPGWGASGRNAGGVIPAPLGVTPTKLLERFGPEKGSRICQFIAKSDSIVTDLISNYGISCEWNKSGYLVAATDEQRFSNYEKSANLWNEAGGAVKILSESNVHEYIATDKYIGGMLYQNAGTINPLSYTRGLAEAVTQAGGTIYANSPAIQVKRQTTNPHQWVVTTPNGKITATKVLLAANAFSADIVSQLKQKYIKLTLAMIASQPFTDKGSEYLTKNIPFMEDDPATLFGVSFDQQGRLFAGVLPSSTTKSNINEIAEPYWSRFGAVFPHAPKDIRWDYLWYGDLCVTAEQFPKIYRLDDGFYAVLGYSGNGITLASALGRDIAMMFTTDNESTFPLCIDKLEFSFVSALLHSAHGVFKPVINSAGRLIMKLRR